MRGILDKDAVVVDLDVPYVSAYLARTRVGAADQLRSVHRTRRHTGPGPVVCRDLNGHRQVSGHGRTGVGPRFVRVHLLDIIEADVRRGGLAVGRGPDGPRGARRRGGHDDGRRAVPANVVVVANNNVAAGVDADAVRVHTVIPARHGCVRCAIQRTRDCRLGLRTRLGGSRRGRRCCQPVEPDQRVGRCLPRRGEAGGHDRLRQAGA